MPADYSMVCTRVALDLSWMGCWVLRYSASITKVEYHFVNFAIHFYALILH